MYALFSCFGSNTSRYKKQLLRDTQHFCWPNDCSRSTFAYLFPCMLCIARAITTHPNNVWSLTTLTQLFARLPSKQRIGLSLPARDNRLTRVHQGYNGINTWTRETAIEVRACMRENNTWHHEMDADIAWGLHYVILSVISTSFDWIDALVQMFVFVNQPSKISLQDRKSEWWVSLAPCRNNQLLVTDPGYMCAHWKTITE